MTARIRILPVIIFTATLALTLRVGGIWTDTDVAVATATAADAAGDKPKAAAKDGQVGSDKAKNGAQKSGSDKHADDASGKQKGVGDTFDPTSVTQAEFQVLQRLATRRAELDKLRRDLALRGDRKTAECKARRPECVEGRDSGPA